MGDGRADAGTWKPLHDERAKLDGADVELIRRRFVRWDPDNTKKMPTTWWQFEVELPDRSRQLVHQERLTDLSEQALRP